MERDCIVIQSEVNTCHEIATGNVRIGSEDWILLVNVGGGDGAGFWVAQVVLVKAAFSWCKPVQPYLELQPVLSCLIKARAIAGVQNFAIASSSSNCTCALTGMGPKAPPTGC